MKLFLTLSLGIFAALASTLSAQALPPIAKTVKVDPKIKQPAGDEVLKHGMKLVINLTDKSSVRGTVVWADSSADYVLLRTTPGAAPKKILGKNIADITRIRLTGDDGKARPDEPEIHEVTVINGTQKTVRYFAPTLSPQERSKLEDMESASNETARVESLLSMTNQALRAELQAAREQNVAQQRQNALLASQLYWLSGGPYYGGYYPAPYGGYYPGYSGYNLGAGGGGSAPSGKLMETVLTKEIALTKELAKLQRNQTQVQGAGLYEDGRLVAVTVEPQK
jgi:hypothetical protein